MKPFLLLTALSGVALSLLAPTRIAHAQSLPPLPIQLEGRTWINPGQPGNRRRGGGSRGGNCYDGAPLTALAYADSVTTEELDVTRTDEAVGALTSLSTPTLWFYLPTALNETTAEFVVKDTQERVLYQGQLTGDTEEAGIVGVQLSAPLSAGSAVRWFLTVDCDESDRTTVDGWIESRNPGPDLARTFTQANSRNRVALYTNYGFLHDALSELARLRERNPNDEAIAQAWGQFLTTLSLGDLADVPVLDCCQLIALDDVPAEPAETELETEPGLEPEAEPEAPTDPEPSEPAEAPEEDSRSILQRARDRGN